MDLFQRLKRPRVPVTTLVFNCFLQYVLPHTCSELIRGREITIQEIRQEKKIEERQRKFDEQRMRLPKLEGYDYDLM